MGHAIYKFSDLASLSSPSLSSQVLYAYLIARTILGLMEASGPTGNIASRDLPSALTADRTDSMADTLLSCRQLRLSVTMFCTFENVPSTMGYHFLEFGRSFLLKTSCHQISGCTGFLSLSTTSGSLGKRDNLSTSESYWSFSILVFTLSFRTAFDHSIVVFACGLYGSILPYGPQANTIIERSNAVLKELTILFINSSPVQQ